LASWEFEPLRRRICEEIYKSGRRFAARRRDGARTRSVRRIVELVYLVEQRLLYCGKLWR
jgi:hypothetical protein